MQSILIEALTVSRQTPYNKPFPQGGKKHGLGESLCRHHHEAGSGTTQSHWVQAPPRRYSFGVQFEGVGNGRDVK